MQNAPPFEEKYISRIGKENLHRCRPVHTMAVCGGYSRAIQIGHINRFALEDK